MSNVFSRRASRSTSCSAATSSRSRSGLSVFAAADSSRSRRPVSGVLSWCDAFETNSRWAASTVPIRSVMSLKAIVTSRCSVAPVTSARASRSPSSTRRAVSASFRSGRESESARNHANTSPRPSAAAPIAASASTLRRTRSCTAPTLCVTRTAPATRPASVTGTALYKRSSPSVSLWRVPCAVLPVSAIRISGRLANERCGLPAESARNIPAESTTITRAPSCEAA